MVDGTLMKYFESQLQQMNSTITDLQWHVNSLEAGSSRNHAAILVMDQKIERVDWRVESIEVTMEGLAQKFDGFMIMFAIQPQVSISPDFPPREWT